MRKIKHNDLAKGTELPYLDPRNRAYAGVIARVVPALAGCPGRGWTRYYICQRGPQGLNQVGTYYTIGAINRTYCLP